MNAPCREKIWFKAGLECGNELVGKVCKLIRALYGLKSSGASWRKMFKDHIQQHLGFTPSITDPDMYYRKAKRPDGSMYYELLLVYVDDVLAMSHSPREIMAGIASHFEIKNDDISEPKIYLAGQTLKSFSYQAGNSPGASPPTLMSRMLLTLSRNYWLKTGKSSRRGIESIKARCHLTTNLNWTLLKNAVLSLHPATSS